VLAAAGSTSAQQAGAGSSKSKHQAGVGASSGGRVRHQASRTCGKLFFYFEHAQQLTIKIFYSILSINSKQATANNKDFLFNFVHQ
jgi:hypothetical protein